MSLNPNFFDCLDNHGGILEDVLLGVGVEAELFEAVGVAIVALDQTRKHGRVFQVIVKVLQLLRACRMHLTHMVAHPLKEDVLSD